MGSDNEGVTKAGLPAIDKAQAEKKQFQLLYVPAGGRNERRMRRTD